MDHFFINMLNNQGVSLAMSYYVLYYVTMSYTMSNTMFYLNFGIWNYPNLWGARVVTHGNTWCSPHLLVKTSFLRG